MEKLVRPPVRFSKPLRPPMKQKYIEPNGLLRNGIVLALDMVRNVNVMLDVLSDSAMPDATKESIITDTARTARRTFDALLEIEKATRPRLAENDDVAYLTRLFKLPDTRNESPLEQ